MKEDGTQHDFRGQLANASDYRGAHPLAIATASCSGIQHILCIPSLCPLFCTSLSTMRIREKDQFCRRALAPSRLAKL